VVTEVNSQRVYLLGEVGKPGPVPLVSGLTILQAISTAGGLSQFANSRKIYVLRNEGGTQRKLAFNYKQALKGESDQNLSLQAGDTIVVP
jgi:polysaccharide export outer membrane protein